jgi:hypothetical protein
MVPDDLGYVIDEAEVIYWGACPDCFAAHATSTNTTRSTNTAR